MNNTLYPFQGVPGTGVLYVTGADAAITNLQKGSRTVLASNVHATEPAYVRIAGSGAATNKDVCIPAGKQLAISKDADETVGRIFSNAAGSCHIICGNGIA